MRQFRQLLVVVAVVAVWAWLAAGGETGHPAAAPPMTARAGEHVIHTLGLDQPGAITEFERIGEPTPRMLAQPAPESAGADEAWLYRASSREPGPASRGCEFETLRLARFGNRVTFFRGYPRVWGVTGEQDTGTWSERGSAITVKFRAPISPRDGRELHFERRGGLLVWRRPEITSQYEEERLNLQLRLQTTQDPDEQQKLNDRLRRLSEDNSACSVIDLKPLTNDEIGSSLLLSR